MRKRTYLDVRLAILVSVTTLTIAGTAGGGIIYVDTDADGANDGSSWVNAYNYLRDALTHANLASKPLEIRVAHGVYTPDSNSTSPDGTGDRGIAFQLINDVTLKGGYAGFGEPDPNIRDIDVYETILSGDLSNNDVDVNDPCDLLVEPTRADNSYYVVVNTYITDKTAFLDGFTIFGGNADGSGGGMNNGLNRGPTICNCTFRSNSASGSGGGMHNEGSSPKLINCAFIGNYSGLIGGAMGNGYGSNPELIDCIFNGNSASSGGGMYNHSSNPTLTNCVFSDNRAEGLGGGMVNASSCPKLSDCTFFNNSAGRGGGIFNWPDSNSTLTNCSFRRNSADLGGGIYNSQSSSLLLTYCIFTENFARVGGGGVYNWKCSPVFTDCAFNGNTASGGGGMSNYYNSNPTLTNCTFSQNSGCGVLNVSSSPTLTNCIFTENLADSGGGIINSSSLGTYTCPMLINCVFNGNLAINSGAGIYNSGSGSTLINCIFIGNVAGRNGGGIWNYGTSLFACSLILKNGTFVANSAANGHAFACDSYQQQYPNNLQVTDCILWDDGDEIWNNDDSTILVSYCNVQGGYNGVGNINVDPLFATGPMGEYYLSQIDAGQVFQSPCVDTGSDSAANVGMDTYTTRTDLMSDSGIVDMGYHYPPDYLGGDFDIDADMELANYVIFETAWSSEIRASE